MKKISLTLLFIGLFNQAFAQKHDIEKVMDSLTNEGKTLYKSEWASWYGEDIFKAKCAEKISLLGGYLSYDTGKGINNVLLSKGEKPKVVGTVAFGYDLNIANYSLDTVTRDLNRQESDLFAIRLLAVKQLRSDTMFKHYQNSSLNPVPIISKGIKRVYILTGPNNNGVVILGNDYLFDFDKKNEITSVKRLHKNIIPITFKPKTDTAQIVVASIHTHLPETGEFITATDICTLMLYEKFTTWNNHIVIGPNYVSIWDCKQDKLAIMTKEAWAKLNPAKTALGNTAKQ